LLCDRTMKMLQDMFAMTIMETNLQCVQGCYSLRVPEACDHQLTLATKLSHHWTLRKLPAPSTFETTKNCLTCRALKISAVIQFLIREWHVSAVLVPTREVPIWDLLLGSFYGSFWEFKCIILLNLCFSPVL
jgi:hypothetical protein